MKIKVRLVQPNVNTSISKREVDKNDPHTISWSETVDYVADCPQKIEIPRKDYPRQNYIIEITE